VRSASRRDEQVRRNNRVRAAAWIGAAVALSFVLRVPFLRVPLTTDEGGYAYVARRWLAGQGDLYADLWFDRPQGIFLAYGMILHTLGGDVVAIRLGAWVVAALTLLLVWAFARDAIGPRAAGPAAVLFALIASSPAIEGFTANAEMFMALPAAGTAWLLLRASRGGWGDKTLLAAGFLAGLATLLKPSGVVMLPLAIAFIWLVGPGGFMPVARRWTGVAAGFSLAILPALAHGWLTGWSDFVFAVTYRVHHRSATTVTLEEHLGALRDLVNMIWPLLVALALPLAAWWLWSGPDNRDTRDTRWPRAETGVLRLVASRPPVKPGTEADILLRLWLLACLAGIAMGGNWFPHYVAQIAAPFAIWIALLLNQLTDRLPTLLWRSLSGLVVAALLLPYSVVIATEGDVEAMGERIFNHKTYAAQDEIAAYLRACTPPETPVYVAFYQASLYYLADRPAAYRHLYRWELLELPGTAEDLIEMVRSPSRPLYVVDLGQQAPFADGGAAFWRAVAENYHLETTIEGLPIYRADESDSRSSASPARCPEPSTLATSERGDSDREPESRRG